MEPKGQVKPSRFADEDITLFCVVILIIGAFFRLFPVWNTVAYFSPHDMGSLVGLESAEVGSGHLGYLEYLVKFGKLPDFSPTERWGFYNPPFFYICGAILWKFLLWMGVPYVAALETVQFLPYLCVLVAVIGCYKILKALEISGAPLVVAVVFLSGHPTLNYLACTLNNDGMSLAFGVWAIFFAVKWYQNPGWRRIWPIAVCIGLGMMTKISIAVIAPGIAFLFAVRFFRDKRWGNYLGQFFGFAGICFPLGLFWPVKNLVQYGLPLNYVQALPENSPQNVEMFSLWERIGWFAPGELVRTWTSFSPNTELGHADYNVWVQLFRSSVIDDNILTIPAGFFQGLTVFLLIASVVFALGMTVALVWLVFQKEGDRMIPVWLALSCAVTLGSYVKFSLDFPVTCSMHFRYVTVFLLYGLIAGGIWWQKAPRGGIWKGIRIGFGLLTVVFSLGASFFYMVCL